MTNYQSRAHLSLNPTRTASADADDQYQEQLDSYLEDQKAQQAESRGGRQYIDIDEAYNLGAGVDSRWYEPGESYTFKARSVDHNYKAQLDTLKANGNLSDAAYQQGLREAGFLDDEPEAGPDAGLAPLQYDEETSNNAQWTIDQVGGQAFRHALTSYVMGDSTAAVNLAGQLQEHGVTPSDITGLYDSMAQTALGKINAVMEANGDLDVDVMDVVQWARGLERGQKLDLARSVMAGALFDNFDLVPELIQAYRLAKTK